jgi:hypothetical protein
MRWAKKEILWVWVVVGADILALGTLTGFWQNLFLPTPNHPRREGKIVAMDIPLDFIPSIITRN